MRYAALIALCAPLAACVAAGSANAPASKWPMRVMREHGMPYAFDVGAAARKQADALCGAGGVRASIYDRYDQGAWVFVEGCA